MGSLETRNKRKTQTAKSFDIKIDKSKVSKEKSDNLQRLFLEGKWFTNYIISKGVTDSVPYKAYTAYCSQFLRLSHVVLLQDD